MAYIVSTKHSCPASDSAFTFVLFWFQYAETINLDSQKDINPNRHCCMERWLARSVRFRAESFSELSSRHCV